MKDHNIELRVLDLNDLQSDILDKFNRYQETNTVVYKDNDEYKFKTEKFIDEWDNDKKILVIEHLKSCINSQGVVVGAFKDNQLIGFANVEGNLLGTNKEYRELTYIHISNEYRNYGVGRKLFRLLCKKAKEKGTKKLYIGAHPSKETQQFYKSMGCIYAKEVIKEIYDREPLDIQLEINL